MRSILCLLLLVTPGCLAQQGGAPGVATPASAEPGAAALPQAADARTEEIRALRAELKTMAARLDALEHAETASAPLAVAPAAVAPVAPAAVTAGAASGTPPVIAAAAAPAMEAAAATPTGFPGSLPGGATLNVAVDGYYEYNFNHPPGRVNDLRAYDVLSNSVSLNQADVIFELAPAVSEGRRYGVRLDLQFGQATETLQGNPANEPRPEVYRNIFQAYGTYVLPVGKGLNVDFGKWASSLGYEGNYTKDQNNYTRSYFFYFLPFYHVGARTSYHVSDKLAVNYWVVNGTNQSEPTNGYKDELFGFVLTPAKNVTWTSNYYLGQDHPDTQASTGCLVPEQPGLCVATIPNAPNGKLHILDNYVSWQARPKLSVTGEFDYVIQRLTTESAPQHVTGGAAYAVYQVRPKASLGVRGEYLSDRGGLFSNQTQALKEATATYKYNVAPGLDAFLEYRRDWSNRPYFTTQTVGAPVNHQDTATLGLVWWYGGKQGAW